MKIDYSKFFLFGLFIVAIIIILAIFSVKLSLDFLSI